jgi:hypothetical protein
LRRSEELAPADACSRKMLPFTLKKVVSAVRCVAVR